MILFAAIPPFLGSIDSVLSGPVIPGRVVVWLLLMLSILSWVMIASRAFELQRFRRGDRRFGRRLRASQTVLEVFEEEWSVRNSLQYQIYLAGARETVFQLLGSRAPVKDGHQRITEAGALTSRQAAAVLRSFRSGYRNALKTLGSTKGLLHVVALTAALLGVFGMAWTLMEGFNAAGEEGIETNAIGTALGFVVIALGVAAPALIAQLLLGVRASHIRLETRKFHDDVVGLFERKFGSAVSALEDSQQVSFPSHRRLSVPEEMPSARQSDQEYADEAEMIDGMSESSEPVGGKKYHSIRQRLLREEEELDSLEMLQVNPIARQAGEASSF